MIKRSNVTRTQIPGQENKEYITKKELQECLYDYDANYAELAETVKGLKEIIGQQHTIIKSLHEENDRLSGAIVILRSMIVTTNKRVDGIINGLDPEAHCTSLDD